MVGFKGFWAWVFLRSRRVPQVLMGFERSSQRDLIVLQVSYPLLSGLLQVSTAPLQDSGLLLLLRRLRFRI